MTRKLQMQYVGYKDRTFVPKRNHKMWTHSHSEKAIKKMLCVLNKIGNAEGAICTVEHMPYKTNSRRNGGTLKRNHYIYNLLVEYQSDDDTLFRHHIRVRTGEGIGVGDDSGGCEGASCNGGFCD